MTTATSPTARQGTYRRFFVVVLGLWVVLSFIPQADFAQDAVPMVVAGELVSDHPDAVYGEGIYEMDDEFVARSCDFVPAGESCDELAVAFLSTPMALPLAWSVALAPDDLGVDLLRLVTSVSLAAGLLVLWKRLVGLHPSMPAILFWSTLILTPLALVAVDLGTTSALLFLSACLGLRHTDDRPARGLALGALWAVNVVLRGFPAVLGLLVLWKRRWWVLAGAAAVVAVLTAGWLVLGPASLLDEFLRSSADVAREAPSNPRNGSLDAILHLLLGSAADSPWTVPILLGRVLLVGGGVVALTRLRTVDAQWAYGAVVGLLLLPLVWSHYLWLVIPAVAYALADRGPFAERGQPRVLLALPIAAAAASLAAATPVVEDLTIVLRFAVLVAALVAVPFVARRPGVAATTAPTTPVP